MATELARLKERILALTDVEGAGRIVGASHHGWRLRPPWTEAELGHFEKQRRVDLPGDYRSWLLKVSASGAGPGNGLFEPGTWDTGSGPKKWTARQVGPLGLPFPHDREIDKHRGRAPGLLPLCDLGCGQLVGLVTSGPQRSKVWLDARRDWGGMRPEGDHDFLSWIAAWLDECEHEVREPWQPPPSHPNQPDRVVPAADIVGTRTVTDLVTEVIHELRTHGKATFDTLGAFVLRGHSPEFSQGPMLAAALEGHQIDGDETLSRAFAAALAAGPWVGVELPGLCLIWLRQQRRTEHRDYLGRPSWVGRDGLAWTVKSLLPSPFEPHS